MCKVRETELDMLSCMERGVHFNLAYEMVKKWEQIARSSKGDIVIGGWVTLLAMHFEVDLERYTSSPPSHIDIDHLKSDLMFRGHGDAHGYFLIIASTNSWRPITTDMVDVRVDAHWYATWMGRALPRFPRYRARCPAIEPKIPAVAEADEDASTEMVGMETSAHEGAYVAAEGVPDGT